MESIALEIAVIAILSPILLAAAILYLLSTANLSISAISLNLLTVTMGGLRFGIDLPGYYNGIVTVLFAFFLILAIVANTRLVFQTSGSKVPKRAAVRKRSSKPQPVPHVPTAEPSIPKPDEKNIRILTSTSWLVRNEWGDIRVYTVPEAVIEGDETLPGSDKKFRIVYEEGAEPVEDTFTISQNLQILLPPDLIDRFQTCELIRFEILD